MPMEQANTKGENNNNKRTAANGFRKKERKKKTQKNHNKKQEKPHTHKNKQVVVSGKGDLSNAVPTHPSVTKTS